VRAYTDIYQVHFKARKYRTLEIRDERFGPDQDWLLNGRKREDSWPCPRVVCPNPEKEPGDFLWMPPNSLVVNQRIADILNQDTYFDAEFLPLDYDNGQKLYALNFLTCTPCLDLEESKVKRDPETGEVTEIIEHAFIPHRLLYWTVFKIPERNGLDIYCYNGLRDRGEHFYDCVNQNKLTGLRFEKVWEFPSFMVEG